MESCGHLLCQTGGCDTRPDVSCLAAGTGYLFCAEQGLLPMVYEPEAGRGVARWFPTHGRDRFVHHRRGRCGASLGRAELVRTGT